MPKGAKHTPAENSAGNNGVDFGATEDELTALIGESKRGRTAQPSVYGDVMKQAVSENRNMFAVHVTDRRQPAWIRTQLAKAAKENGLEPRKDYSILDRSDKPTKQFPNGAVVFVFNRGESSE